MRVFVSHHSSTRGVAEHVTEYLERHGVPCWVAPRDVRAGNAWDAEIIRGLNSCSALLLLFSEGADDSEHVKKELMLAGRRRLPVLPLRLEDVQPVVLEYLLVASQWIDWIDRRDATLEALAERLMELATSEDVTNRVEPAHRAAFVGDEPGRGTPLGDGDVAAGRSFGVVAPNPAPSWPFGPYARCSHDRLHLVSAAGDGRCALCLSGGDHEQARDDWAERAALRTWGSGEESPRRARWHPDVLVGRTLIKVHSSARSWFVELHADGACTETSLDGVDECYGDWGCDGAGLLVLSLHGYQLVVAGSVDGVGRGLESIVQGAHAPGEPEHFRVGVMATRHTSTAIKLTSKPSAFRVDFYGSRGWTAAVEEPLFGGAPEETVPWDIGDHLGVTFDVFTRDIDGHLYRAMLNRTRGEREVWVGPESWTDDDGNTHRNTVTLVSIEPGVG